MEALLSLREFCVFPGYLQDAIIHCREAFNYLASGHLLHIAYDSFESCYYIATWTLGKSAERQRKIYGEFFAMGTTGEQTGALVSLGFKLPNSF